MKTIALIIMVSIVLEALVEYGKTIDHMVVSRDYKTAITQGITIVLGIALAFVFKVQLFNEGLSEVYQGLAINPYIDMVLTGILFSRGSNFFSDLVSKLQRKNTVEILGTEFVGDSMVPDEDDEEEYEWLEDEWEDEYVPDELEIKETEQTEEK